MDDEHRVLLIDLDNCPRQVDGLPQALGSFDRVIICHRANADPRVPLSLVRLLSGALDDGRLQIVAMPRSGKNAADMGLAFWAGHAAAELPESASFVVLSHDHHLDHVVDMLQLRGRHAERVAGRSVPASGDGQRSGEPGHEAAEEYIHALLASSGSRPARRKTLVKSIKTFLKSQRSAIRAESVLASLLERGIVYLDDQSRVSYSLDEEELARAFDEETCLEGDEGCIPF